MGCMIKGAELKVVKVVLINHGTAGEWGGGDSVQIKETAKRLIQRGHKVSIQNSDRPSLENADIAHIFNCRVYNSLKQQVNTCRDAGVPIVISPIWMPLGRAMWGSRGIFSVLKKGVDNGEQSIREDLENMRNRKMEVISNGNIYRYNIDKNSGLEWINDVGEILNHAEGVLPNSWLELKSLQLDLNFKGNNYDVAYYGVDPGLFSNSEPNIFRDTYDIKEPFVMQAGRIEPGKNQAMLCWALRKTNIRIVLIGSKHHWPEYAELCKKISGNKLKIIEHYAARYAGISIHSSKCTA